MTKKHLFRCFPKIQQRNGARRFCGGPDGTVPLDYPQRERQHRHQEEGGPGGQDILPDPPNDPGSGPEDTGSNQQDQTNGAEKIDQGMHEGL